MHRSIWFAAVVALLASAAPHAIMAKVPVVETQIESGDIAITVLDLTPRFLDFYEKAAKQDVTPDQRFALWEEFYGFAAVPPTPEGKAMARELLDEAWDKYPAALDIIRKGAGGMKPSPEVVVAEVRQLLGHEEPFKVRYVTYVGGFDNNAFAGGAGDTLMIAMPVEMSEEDRLRTLRHEMTHAVHTAVAKLSGGWERSVAELIVQEGLAMRTAHALQPDAPERLFLAEHKPGWVDEAMAKAPAILNGIRPALAHKDSETVFRFTVGTGATGTEREAYVAGWLVVGHWLEQGRTLAEIARIPEADMVAEVEKALAEMQAAQF